MKLTHNTKRAKGLTLLELTVVILVLLSLIAILFVGAQAWKKGSDRSANILNVRNVQQAMRGHSNMHGIGVGGGLVATEELFPDYMQVPSNPITGATDYYEYETTVPDVGALYVTNPQLTDNEGEYFYDPAAFEDADDSTDGNQTPDDYVKYPQVSEW